MISYVLHRLDPTLSPVWDGSVRPAAGRPARGRSLAPKPEKYWDVTETNRR